MLSPSAGLSFADCPNGVAALSKIPLYGLIQIFLFIGFLETQVKCVHEHVQLLDFCPGRWRTSEVQRFITPIHRLHIYFIDLVQRSTNVLLLTGLDPDARRILLRLFLL